MDGENNGKPYFLMDELGGPTPIFGLTPICLILSFNLNMLRVFLPRGNHLSHEKNPGWLGYIGDYTTQLYRDFNKPL